MLRKFLLGAGAALSLLSMSAQVAAQTVIGFRNAAGTARAVTPAERLPVDIGAGTVTVNGVATTTKATAAAPSYTEGTVSNPFSVDLAGNQRFVQPLTTGAKTPGAAAPNSGLIGCIYTSAGVTLTTGQQVALQCDSTGHLLGVGSGGGGGAVTSTIGAFPDGWSASAGATTDSACATDNGTCAELALLKRNNQRITSLITATGSPFQVGGSIGNTAFGISGTLPSFTTTQTFNLGALNGAATAALQGAQGTGAAYNPPTGGSGELGYLSGLLASALDTTPSAVKIDQTSTNNNVVVASSALPTGAATSANQATNNTSVAAVASVLGTTSDASSATGTAEAILKYLAAQMTTALPAGSNTIGNIANVSGTVSLPTGASTSANQASVIGSKAPGTAAASSLLEGGVYNSAGVTLTDGQQAGLQMDAAGSLKVAGTLTTGGLAQGSTTSGQTGSLSMGAVTTSAPTYTTAQTSPLSLTTAGALRVDNSANTQPVSGSLTNISGTISLPTGAATSANQATANTSLGAVASVLGTTSDASSATGTAEAILKYLAAQMTTALPAGSNLIGGTTPTATTSGGLSTVRVVTGTSGVIKASAGGLFHVIYQNTNAAVRYIQIYDKATAPTLSTDTPIATCQMALTSRGECDLTIYGVSGAAGLAWAVTTDDVAIPTTAGSSGDLHATFLFK
jgi:hypothetical protein